MGSGFFPILLLILLVLTAIYCVECVLYYARVTAYYRRGPAILREEWQCSAPATAVRAAIWPLLQPGGLSGRETPDGFCIRQRLVSFNTFPRIWLGVRDGPAGAILSYEVRPFISMALIVPPLLLIPTSMHSFHLLSVILPAALAAAAIFAGYKWLQPYDLKRINRLPAIRAALAPLGLQVCEQCGYDLHGRAKGEVCPECGAQAM